MQRIARMFLAALTFLGVLLMVPTAKSASAATVRYAKDGGLASGSCNSWANACTLQYALNSAAVSGDEIWVAGGTYKPHASDRTVSFVLRNGVKVYGGYSGTGSQRDIVAYPTILSGDLHGDDNAKVHYSEQTRAENAYHVVVGDGTDSSAVLDGVTITGGNANDTTWPNNTGGGMLIQGGDPTLKWVTFSANSARGGGGGMRNEASSPTVENVTFSNNAAGGGGGMLNGSSSPKLTNVTFSGNSANGGGGGMYNVAESIPTLTNVTFSGNSAFNGGGMYNGDSNPFVANVSFATNTADFGGGMYNINASGPTVINVTFDANTAINFGGGMYNVSGSDPTLIAVTFDSNSSQGAGGGMANDNGSSPTLTNVTFSGNSANSFGGGMYNYFVSSPELINVTFANNSAAGGGGLANLSSSSPLLINVISAGSSNGQDCYNDSTGSVAAASSYNLIESAVHYCGLNLVNQGNIVGQNPALGPLSDNGGPTTETHALLGTSPAIDAGTCDSDLGVPTMDQRGWPRPQGLACDIGAYEAERFVLFLPLIQR